MTKNDGLISELFVLYLIGFKSSSITLGAQNCHYYENYGPFTGSVSASMLKKILMLMYLMASLTQKT